MSSMEDDIEWEDMPVIHSDNAKTELELKKQWKAYREDPDRLDFEAEERSDDEGSSSKKKKARGTGLQQLGRVNAAIGSKAGDLGSRTGNAAGASTKGANATGNLIDFDDAGAEWREKSRMDERDYTRLEGDDDPEDDEVHTRTQYLFDDDKGMTPLSQMQTTKTMLTEGQRIAYVGLCRLVTREMAQALKGLKELEPATESIRDWGSKIMLRLYQHMEIEPAGKLLRQKTPCSERAILNPRSPSLGRTTNDRAACRAWRDGDGSRAFSGDNAYCAQSGI